MNKLISPRVHGYLDYVLVATFLGVPTLLHFSSVPAKLAYVLAAVHLTMTILTRFPLGAFKLIPFPFHGWVELGVSFALMLLPMIFGFNDEANAVWFFRAAGLLVFVIWMTTDCKGVKELTSSRQDPAT